MTEKCFIYSGSGLINGSAFIAGDIAMLEHEVNSVIRALPANTIEVVTLHNHMPGDTQEFYFCII